MTTTTGEAQTVDGSNGASGLGSEAGDTADAATSTDVTTEVADADEAPADDSGSADSASTDSADDEDVAEASTESDTAQDTAPAAAPSTQDAEDDASTDAPEEVELTAAPDVGGEGGNAGTPQLVIGALLVLGALAGFVILSRVG